MYRTVKQHIWHRSRARGWYAYCGAWARMTFYTPAFENFADIASVRRHGRAL